MTEHSDSWWRRPAGGRDVLQVALPLMISTASWTAMHFIDRMFLLWHSPAAIAAALPAGMMHFTTICFPLGIALYVNTFVAQYHGAGRPERIGPAVWHGVRVGLYATPLFLLAIPLAPVIFAAAGHEPVVQQMEIVYFQVLAFGAGGSVISAALATFYTGRGATSTVMLVNIGQAFLNVALDYAWVFGHWGFPALGIEGAGWATVVSIWWKVVVYGILISAPSYRERYNLAGGRRFDPDLFWRMLRYGGANGIQMVVDVAAFTLFVLLVGGLGTHQLAATTLAFNVNSVAFVPLIGLGVAISTMVGRHLGEDRPDLAARATWTSASMALAYMGFFAALYVGAPDLFLFGHAWGSSEVEFGALRNTVVVLLRFVAAYCLFDALIIVFSSAIKGAGDTRFIMVTTAWTSGLLVLAAWLGMQWLGLGLFFAWALITAWVLLLGLIYLARFLQGKWRRMRVIEPALDSESEGGPVAIETA